MAERDTFVTVADGDQLNEGYYNGIRTEVTSLDTERAAVVAIDQTEASIDNNTSETLIGGVTISANTVKTGVLVIANGYMRVSYSNNSQSATTKL
jgi:hypothetical protein